MPLMLDAHLAVPSRPVPPARGLMPLRSLVFSAMGLPGEIRYLTPTGEADPDFERGVGRWIAAFELRYSLQRPESALARINAAAGADWVLVDAEMERMLDRASVAFALSGGLLDGTAGPLGRLWDDGSPSPVEPAAAALAQARELVGWSKVHRAPGRIRLPRAGMAVDFGGWADAWAVDALIGLAREGGIRHAMVRIGRKLRCLGTPPGRPAWHIGLEDPARPEGNEGSVALPAGAAIASACGCLRGFAARGRRDGPMVDPRSGRLVTSRVRQVTVIADDCFQAGLLATTAFVLGPQAGREFVARFPGAEAVIVADAGRVETSGFWSHVVS